jgi:hypothetical protein
MARLEATDLAACGLAAAAGALGYASNTGSMLLLLGVATAAAGFLRARMALGLSAIVVAPILLVIGRSRPSFVAGVLFLAAAGVVWLVVAVRSGPVVLQDLSEEVLAARIVLAGVFLVLVGILARFAGTYSI